MIERLAAALLLAACAGVGWLESRSHVAESLRRQGPWAFWLALREAPGAAPRLHLALYQPVRRRLDLVYFPAETRLPDGQSLGAFYARARKEGWAEPEAAQAAAEAARELALRWLPEESSAAAVLLEDAPAGPEPAHAAAAWLAARSKPLPGRNSNLSRLDRLVLALELRRVEPRPAWLPEPEERDDFFSGLLGEPPPPPDPLVAEVLNATGQRGIAFAAAKVLRSEGVDVLSVGNAPPGAPARTVIYSRSGRHEDALRLRRALGCMDAPAVTQTQARRLVDATVLLGPDCRPRGMGD